MRPGVTLDAGGHAGRRGFSSLHACPPEAAGLRQCASHVLAEDAGLGSGDLGKASLSSPLDLWLCPSLPTRLLCHLPPPFYGFIPGTSLRFV